MSDHPFVKRFEHLLLEGLPGETAHQEMMPVNRPLSSKALKEATNYRQSAVAVVLFERDNSLECILIQRPVYKGAHSGQISFPGGKMDPTDFDLEFTAKREAMEEVSLIPEAMHTIGSLSQVYIPVSKFLVQPYVFFVEELPELIADNREVDEIITFNIELLQESHIRQLTDIKLGAFTQKNVPYFNINGRTVWGATAMILSEFKSVMKSF